MRGQLAFRLELPGQQRRQREQDRRPAQRALTAALVVVGLTAYLSTHAPPVLRISPGTSLYFGAQTVRSQGEPQTIQLAISDSAVLGISDVSLSGDEDFAVNSGDCIRSTAASVCKISVAFRPAAEGPRSAVLTILRKADSRTQLVSLSGAGVAVPPTPPSTAPVRTVAILSFSASPHTIQPGQTSSLCYQVENAVRARIQPGIGATDPGGQCATVTPGETTPYTLAAEGTDGRSVTRQVTVAVVPVLTTAQILSFAASPARIRAGERTQLCYQLARASRARIAPNIGDVPAAASHCVSASPSEHATYRLEATGSDNRTVIRQVEVAVVRRARILHFQAQPQLVRRPGERAQLCYEVAETEQASIEPEAGPVETRQRNCVFVAPSRTTDYTLTAIGSDRTPVTQSATIALSLAPATVRLWADRRAAFRGQPVNICYEVREASYADITPYLGRVQVPGRGCSQLPLQRTTIFTLRAQGLDGQIATARVRVIINTLDPDGGMGPGPGHVTDGVRPEVGEPGTGPGHTPPAHPGLPDLVASLQVTGRATASPTGELHVPVLVMVQNRGTGAAGPFKVSIEANGKITMPFSVSGQQNRWYPTTNTPLSPGQSIRFSGTAILPAGQGTASVSLASPADSCSGDEIMTNFCRVQESNEQNNVSRPATVQLSPPFRRGIDRRIDPRAIHRTPSDTGGGQPR